MEFLDKSLRVLYEMSKDWLMQYVNVVYQSDLDSLQWLEPILLVVAGCVAFFMAALVVIFVMRLIGYACFKLDQAAHWLAGGEKPVAKPFQPIWVEEFGRWRVQGHERNPTKAAKRRREWKKKQLSPREIREIEERNRSRL